MTRIFLFALLATLYACGADESEERRDDTVGKEIAEGYNRQMDEAREVENQLMEQKRALDDAIDASEQGKQDP
jgi:hypothetical protein